MKLITLTVNPKSYETPREAYDDTRRKLSQLACSIRRKFSRFEYLKVLEVTKAGWPHYHLVASCGYIPQPWLSHRWDELTGARIVDIRKIHKGDDVYFYILKYLSKCKHIPWTNRRVSWSRGFFPKKTQPKGFPLGLEEKLYFSDHPTEILKKLWDDKMVAAFNKDVVLLNADYRRAKEIQQDAIMKHAIDAAEYDAEAKRKKDPRRGGDSSIEDQSDQQKAQGSKNAVKPKGQVKLLDAEKNQTGPY